MRDYEVLGLPTSFFIDREGVVRGVWTGKLSPARLKELVAPLIGETLSYERPSLVRDPLL